MFRKNSDFKRISISNSINFRIFDLRPLHRQSSIVTDEGRDIRYRPSFWRITKVNDETATTATTATTVGTSSRGHRNAARKYLQADENIGEERGTTASRSELLLSSSMPSPTSTSNISSVKSRLRWKRTSTPPENEGEGGRMRSGVGELELRGEFFERRDRIDER